MEDRKILLNVEETAAYFRIPKGKTDQAEERAGGLVQPKHRNGRHIVEICRNQANRDRNENPCRWRVCAICRGF